MNVSFSPEGFGCSSTSTCVALSKSSSVSIDCVEYLISYLLACPILPSSPTAVQVSVTELDVTEQSNKATV